MGSDSFGHFWGDEGQYTLLDFEWVEISESGEKVLAPESADKVNLKLNPPLVLYGKSHPEVAVSVNGYISSDPTDDGGDETNDCPFPGPVSSGGGARIAVLHDNLEIDPAGGGIYHQYFSVSPHSWKTCGVHVIQWENVRHVGSTATFDFQVLLFDNFEIVMQYGPGNAEAGSGSSTGIQNLAASLGNAGAVGMKVACDFNGGIPANYVLAMSPPRELVSSIDDLPGIPQVDTLRGILIGAKNGSRIEFDSSLDGETIELALDNGGSGALLEISNKVFCIDAGFGLDEGITIRGLKDSETLETTSVRVTEGSDVRFHEVDFEPHQSDPLRYTVTAVGDPDDVTDNHCTISQSTITPAELHPIICNSTNMQLNAVSIYGGGIVLNNGGDGSLFHFGLGESSIAGSPVPAVESEGNYEVRIVDSNLNLNFADVIKAAGHTDVWILDSNILFNLGRGVEADLAEGGFVRVEDSSISFNTVSATSQGGAMRVLGVGGVIIERSTISGNSITHDGGATNRGAGIYMSSEGLLNITDTTFSGNRCEEGAAIYAAGLGAGILRDSRILRSTFSGNEATLETVMRMASTDLSLEVSTIAENVGSPVLKVEVGSEVELCVNTFHLNEAERLLSVGDGTDVDAQENIFSLGTASFFVGTGNFLSVGANLCDKSPTKLDAVTDVLGVDPMLGTFATHGGYTKCFMPLPGSPAIDEGLPALYCAFNDQRGLSRFVDGDGNGASAVDIGSVEYQGEVIVTTHLDEVADPGAGVSLREALDLVSPGGLITFAEGMGGRTFALNSQLILNKDVTVSAASLLVPPNISGGGSVGVMKLNGVQAAFENLNIVDGRTAGAPGAGIQVVGGAEGTFDNCEVRRCRSGSSGGGLYVDGLSTLLMRDCLVSGNEVTAAGGGKGGGVFGADGCEIQLVRCQVSGNSTLSLGSGGGIAVEGGDPGALDIKRCSIVRNTCGLDGAGLHLEDVPSFVLTNSTISGNVSADGGGGGIFATGFTTGAITFSTIADNACESGAGGIDQTPNSDVSISHTILAANRNASGLRNAKLLQKVTSLGHNLCDDALSLEAGVSLGDIVNQAAHLAPLANYGRGILTHSLLQISPAIDGGSLQVFGAPPVDQRGYARIQDGDRNGTARVDIGAFEAGRPAIVTTELDETANNGETSLREALAVVSDGGRIVFDPQLSGLNINVNAAKGSLTVNQNIQIDATTLPGGIKIDGQNAVQCLRVTAERPVALNAIQIKNGHTDTNGGGIQSNGDLVLNYCTLRDNNAVVGGGAIACSAGELFAWNSFFFSNTSGTAGSAVRLVSDARAKFEHCTLAENTSGSGEGVIGVNQNRMIFYSTLFAANGVHFFNEGGALVYDLIESRGYNLVDSTGGVLFTTFNEEGDVLTNDAVIGAASNTGGWAPIIPILSGGPARDAGNPEESLLASFDVRGFVREEGAAVDIGGMEFNGKIADLDADGIPDWWELLHGFDPDDSSDANDDPDSDNESNLAEYQAGTHPRKSDLVDPDPTPTPLRIISVRKGAAPDQLTITFASDPGVVYRVYASASLEGLNDVSFSAEVLGASEGHETTIPVQGLVPERSFFLIKIFDH